MRLFLLTLSLLVLTSSYSYGQIVHDLNKAKSIALKENKLIIVDFWATWCGPCKKMDRELWNVEEYKKAYDKKFVLLKVDIDNKKALAAEYGVTSIPRVTIITANEDRLLNKSGYVSPPEYVKLFNSFPDDLGDLNLKLKPIVDNKDHTVENMFSLAGEFRDIGRNADDVKVKSIFLTQSNDYLKKCEKKSDSEELKSLAILSQLRNDAYRGKYKKVVKKLGKLKIDKGHKEATELRAFIYAYCYFKEENFDEMNDLVAKIDNQDYLDELRQ